MLVSHVLKLYYNFILVLLYTWLELIMLVSHVLKLYFNFIPVLLYTWLELIMLVSHVVTPELISLTLDKQPHPIKPTHHICSHSIQ